jgi:uncharacterized damage-inducible protein DinB
MADQKVTMSGERETLQAFLDMQRGILVRKVRGLAEDQARRRLVPSGTTLAGLVRHLTWVEREWFRLTLAGEDITLPADDGWDTGDQPVEELIGDYEAACAESRAVAGSMELSDGSKQPHKHLGQVSLRWVLVHMIEETSRHLGQADILREQTDGATGFDG